METIAKLIKYSVDNFDNEKLLNYKSKSISSKTFFEKSFYFACGLKEIGFKKNQALAIASYQNPSWLIADLGCILAGGFCVPIFKNISYENFLFQMKDSNVSYLMIDHKDFDLSKLKLKKVISCNKRYDDKAMTFSEIIDLGKRFVAKYDLNKLINDVKADDLLTIIYTSGSTGNPKGVELTHKNLVSQVLGSKELFPLNSKDVALSYLPLAHIFERMVMNLYIFQGVSIHFVDDINNLGNLLKTVKPTVMTTVPRMLEKVFLKIKDGVEEASGVKGILARNSLERALIKDVETSKNFSDFIYNAIIYKKFKQGLGGRIQKIICGGAALSNDMERFYKNIGINIFCGYGLTETSPVLAVNYEGSYKFATVGKTFPGVKLKLAKDGELLACGPNIMRGYHNNPKKTAEVMDGEWFKTGDLAKIGRDGFVKITGRKKELFKTAYSKYVAPVPIEQKLVQELRFILGAIIIAEGKQFTSCVLFADFDLLDKFKKKLNCEKLDDRKFIKSAKLNDYCQKIIDKINKKLNKWEKVRKFYISSDKISIDSGEITPSMKLKRSLLEKKYKKKIDEFYLSKTQ